VQRFEQTREEALARRARPRLAFGRNPHRRLPRVLLWFRVDNMSAGAKKRCELFHSGFVVLDK